MVTFVKNVFFSNKENSMTTFVFQNFTLKTFLLNSKNFPKKRFFQSFQNILEKRFFAINLFSQKNCHGNRKIIY